MRGLVLIQGEPPGVEEEHEQHTQNQVMTLLKP